ncbi:MAG: acyltransferase [Prevotella sp.]|nr:acyltransferase [Prevotella sp.]
METKSLYKKFDDIRPYNDDEIPMAMERISENELFPLVASYVYPSEPLEDVRQRIVGYKTTYDFQINTMWDVNRRIIKNSITDFSCSGFEWLQKDKSYLYVSNHRDIMLDSCLLQYALVKNGFDTSEITFGANLMVNQFVIDIGRSNKMFKIERPNIDKRKFYRSSLLTSEYIRYAITEKCQSVWIAQRNGRAKDSNDFTDPGVIKMFCMIRKEDKVKALSELNIVPIAVSYEWESCDMLKTIELFKSQNGVYIKQPGEDMKSVLTGIMQQKGRVHIELCEPISNEELEECALLPDSDFHKAVAKIIDKRIISAYRLYPNNYIAYDILKGTSRFSDKYDTGQREKFIFHMDECEKYDDYDINQLKKIYLGIYANPVANKLIYK